MASQIASLGCIWILPNKRGRVTNWWSCDEPLGAKANRRNSQHPRCAGCVQLGWVALDQMLMLYLVLRAPVYLITFDTWMPPEECFFSLVDIRDSWFTRYLFESLRDEYGLRQIRCKFVQVRDDFSKLRVWQSGMRGEEHGTTWHNKADWGQTWPSLALNTSFRPSWAQQRHNMGNTFKPMLPVKTPPCDDCQELRMSCDVCWADLRNCNVWSWRARSLQILIGCRWWRHYLATFSHPNVASFVWVSYDFHYYFTTYVPCWVEIGPCPDEGLPQDTHLSLRSQAGFSEQCERIGSASALCFQSFRRYLACVQPSGSIEIYNEVNQSVARSGALAHGHRSVGASSLA